MTKKNKMKRITVLLSSEDKKKLEDVSDEKGISVSGLVRMVVKEWLKKNQQ